MMTSFRRPRARRSAVALAQDVQESVSVGDGIVRAGLSDQPHGIGELLRKLSYSLPDNWKRREGDSHRESRRAVRVLQPNDQRFPGGVLAGDPGWYQEEDTRARRLDLLVDDAELAARRQAWTPPPPHYQRGYGALFAEHVLQADEGCDFDYLVRAGRTAEPEIH